MVCEILVPQLGINLAPLQWEHGVLTTGQWGETFLSNLEMYCSSTKYLGEGISRNFFLIDI